MDDLAKSYAYSRRIARSRARNFYYAFRFLPAERRKSIFAVYAYSRRLDDAVDSVSEEHADPDEARQRLEFLRGFLGRKPPDDPLVPALRDTIERYSIPLVHFEELIAGMAMDLDRRRYATFEELRHYCYRAASVIGLISIEIFGHRGEAATPPAVDLGIAMQLTNILRDVSEDLERDRVYIPLEDLRRFRYSEADLRQRVVDDRFRDLMRFQVQRARSYFERAEPLFGLLEPESRYCPILLERLYTAILDRIERQNYDVLHERPRLPVRRKVTLAIAAWWEARRARSVRST